KPRGVEHSLFEVELPGAVLLREQPALQPVGEAGDDALQMLQLLVEIGAQPRQFLRVAQFLGADHFVEARGEGAIVGAARRVPAHVARAPGLGGVVAAGGVGILRAVGGRRVVGISGLLGCVVGGELGIFGRGAVLGVFAFGGVLLVRLIGVLVVVLVPVVLLAVGELLLAHVERGEQFMHRLGETALVVDLVGKPVELPV